MNRSSQKPLAVPEGAAAQLRSISWVQGHMPPEVTDWHSLLTPHLRAGLLHGHSGPAGWLTRSTAFDPLFQGSPFSSWCCWWQYALKLLLPAPPPAAARSFWGMQTRRPHPNLLNQNLHVSVVLRWFVCTLRFWRPECEIKGFAPSEGSKEDSFSASFSFWWLLELLDLWPYHSNLWVSLNVNRPPKAWFNKCT